MCIRDSSKELQIVLDKLRRQPMAIKKYVTVCKKDFEDYRIGIVTGVRGQPVEILEESFSSEEACIWDGSPGWDFGGMTLGDYCECSCALDDYGGQIGNYELSVEYYTNYVGPSIFLQGTNLFNQGTNLFYNGVESLLETFLDQIYSIFLDYETEGVFDCEGCINDINNNDICDEFEIACPYPEFVEYSDNAPIYDVESCETFIIYGCIKA